MTSDLPNKIREAALNTLSVEKTAIQDLESAINEVFVRLVTFIHDETNRVVLSGIGKSAIVSQKIVATLNSTGTPAMFMHAADAIHGDLGMIQPDLKIL